MEDLAIVELHSGVIEECSYVSRLSYDCYYYYTTAKANVRFLDGSASGTHYPRNSVSRPDFMTLFSLFCMCLV